MNLSNYVGVIEGKGEKGFKILIQYSFFFLEKQKYLSEHFNGSYSNIHVK